MNIEPESAAEAGEAAVKASTVANDAVHKATWSAANLTNVESAFSPFADISPLQFGSIILLTDNTLAAADACLEASRRYFAAAQAYATAARAATTKLKLRFPTNGN